MADELICFPQMACHSLSLPRAREENPKVLPKLWLSANPPPLSHAGRVFSRILLLGVLVFYFPHQSPSPSGEVCRPGDDARIRSAVPSAKIHKAGIASVCRLSTQPITSALSSTTASQTGNQVVVSMSSLLISAR